MCLHQKWYNLWCFLDDTILAGVNGEELDIEIASLGVRLNQVSHSFQFWNEGEVLVYEKRDSKEYLIPLSGLTEKVIQAGGMGSANGVDTPTTGEPVWADLDGPAFSEDLE